MDGPSNKFFSNKVNVRSAKAKTQIDTEEKTIRKTTQISMKTMMQTPKLNVRKIGFHQFWFLLYFLAYSNYEYDIENLLNYSFQPFETWKANLSRLEGTCRKFLKSYFNSADFRNCKKLGAWKKRADGLLDTMNVMKKICLKMRQSGETMYN